MGEGAVLGSGLREVYWDRWEEGGVGVLGQVGGGGKGGVLGKVGWEVYWKSWLSRKVRGKRCTGKGERGEV